MAAVNDPRFEVYPRKRAGEGAPMNTEDGPAPSLPEYGWRLRAANGQIIAIGGEGFTRRADAHRAVNDQRQDRGRAAIGAFVDQALHHRANVVVHGLLLHVEDLGLLDPALVRTLFLGLLPGFAAGVLVGALVL